MKFNVIVNAHQKKVFPIIRLADGTPCIGVTGAVVISATHKPVRAHTTTNGMVLYEVHPGDFIGTCDSVNGVVHLSSYRVDDVSGSHVVYTEAIL